VKIIRDLTTKQAAVLKFLQNKINEEGRPPTIREIGGRFGFKSTGTTRDYLRSLHQKGYIKLRSRQSRSIELVKSLTLRVPILGHIMAGMPDLATEEIEDYIHLDEWLSDSERQVFALKIKGDSMIEDHIMNGDFVIIEKRETADDGEVVVALINNTSATLKRLFREKDRIRLEPANSLMKPIFVKDIAVQGVVKGLFRKF